MQEVEEFLSFLTMPSHQRSQGSSWGNVSPAGPGVESAAGVNETHKPLYLAQMNWMLRGQRSREI